LDGRSRVRGKISKKTTLIIDGKKVEMEKGGRGREKIWLNIEHCEYCGSRIKTKKRKAEKQN
jgi:DNA-directed RNA polymerase subunit RPC12/RpoP